MPEGGTSFLAVIKNLWNGLAFLLLEAKARRTIIICLVLLGFLYPSIKLGIEENTPRYVIDKIVTSLVSADNGMNIEVEHVLQLQSDGQLPKWKIFVSLFKLLGLIYTSYWLFGLLIYTGFNKLNQTSEAKNFFMTIIVIILIQVAGSLYIIYTENTGNFYEDTQYVMGEKSAFELIKFLNPFKGTINLVRHIDIYLDPLAQLGQKLNH